MLDLFRIIASISTRIRCFSSCAGNFTTKLFMIPNASSERMKIKLPAERDASEAPEERKDLAHGVSRGLVIKHDPAPEGRKSHPLFGVLFRPYGARPFHVTHPRLTPRATIFRPFGALFRAVTKHTQRSKESNRVSIDRCRFFRSILKNTAKTKALHLEA